MSWVLIGYGQWPWLAFVWGFGLVITNWIVFHKDKMQKKGAKDENAPPFGRIWYGIDVFAPVISLDVASAWQPKERCRSLWWWQRFVRLAGWLLVPIGLAAIAGLIK